MSEVTPTLQIQIRDNSQEAARGVDALSTALERLRKAVSGGLGLGSIATEIDRLTSAVRVAKNDDVAGNLNKIASALSKLSNAKNAGTAPAVKQIEQLQDRYTGLTESANQAKEAIQAPLEAQTSSIQTAGEQITNEMESVVNSAAKIQESVAEAKEGIGEGTVNTGSFTKGMTETMSVAELLKMRIDSIRQKMDKLSEAKQPNNDQLARMEMQVRNLQAQYDKLIAKQQEAIAAQRMAAGVSAFSAMMEQKLSVLALPAPVAESISGVAEATGQISESADSATNLASAMQSVSDASVAAESGMTGAVQVVDELPPTAKSASFSLDDLQKKLKTLTRSSADTRRGFLGLFSSFVRIAKFRLFRTIIREISEGFATGLKNVKAYSHYVGTSYYPATVKANQALLQMKNALGAASAPFLESLVPLLQTVTNWVITASNVFNQFVALLTGKTSWTRAIVPTAESLEETEQRARGASNRLKELLADWDELNIIQSESGGGGFGNPNNEEEQIRSMFEQVSKFDENIRKIVNFLTENIERVKRVVGEIGIAIGLWTLSPVLGSFFGWIGGITSGLIVIDVVFNLSEMLTGKYLESGESGWLLLNVLETFLGAHIAEKIFTSVLGNQFGMVAFSITLLASVTADVVAIAGNSNIDALSEEAMWVYLLDALKGGLAAGVIGFAITGNRALALEFGLGGALASVGVALTVKALIESYERSDIGTETYVALALGSLGLSSGIGISSYVFSGKIPVALAAGGAVLATVGVAIGVVAALRSIREGVVDDDTYISLGLGALGITAGSALVGYSVGGKRLAATIGAVSGLAAIGVMFGVTAVLQEYSDGDYTEILRDKAISSITMGGAFALAAYKFGGHSVLKAAGFGAAGALLTLGVETLVQAVIKETKAEGITGEVLGEYAKSSLELAGAAFLGAKLMGLTTIRSVAGGVGAVGVTFGVLAGIAAVIEAKKSGVSKQSLMYAAASSLAMALGGSAIALMTGATIGSALGVGAAFAIATGLTIAAAVSVQTVLKAEKASVEWGDATATEEEIRAYVSSKLFKVDARTTIDLISAEIRAGDEVTESLRTQVAQLMPDWNKIELGIATNETVDHIMDQLFGTEEEDAEGVKKRVGGLMETIDKLVEQNIKTLNVGLTLVPVLGENGENESAEFINTTSAEWTNLNRIVHDIGEDLGKELSKGFSEDGLANFDVDTVKALQDKLNNITVAITGGRLGGSLAAKLAGNLANLDQGSFEQAAKYFAEYEEELRKGYTEIYSNIAADKLALAQAYLASGDTEMYEKVYAEYLDFIAKMPESVNKAVENSSEQGREMLRNAILKLFGDALSGIEFNPNVLGRLLGNQGETVFTDLLYGIFSNKPGSETSGLLYTALGEWFKNIFTDPKDAETLLAVLKSGAVSMADVFGEKYTNLFATQLLTQGGFEFTEEQKLQFAKMLGLDSLTDLDDETMKKLKPDSLLGGFVEAAGEAAEAVGGSIMAGATQSNRQNTSLVDAFVSATNASETLGTTTKNTAEDMVRNFDNATAAVKRLNAEIYRGALLGGIEPFTRGRIPSVPTVLRADGGFVTSGELFVAQESGPEVIGRIGSRSAVANTDQIVSGIAGGVAAGQEEQNVLLRQQNEYLRRLLAKDSTVRVQPSAEWGKFNKRSEEMRLVNAGV